MGRVLGIDVGSVRVGVAITDPGRTVAVSRAVYPRESATAEIAAIASEEEVELLVVGLPIGMDGNEGQAAASVREYATELGQATGLDVEFMDERLSTVAASSAMRAVGVNSRKGRKDIDKVAATVLLQSWLEARR